MSRLDDLLETGKRRIRRVHHVHQITAALSVSIDLEW
jgi:hypothetical protein